jgi:hypothetical protein
MPKSVQLAAVLVSLVIVVWLIITLVVLAH